MAHPTDVRLALLENSTQQLDKEVTDLKVEVGKLVIFMSKLSVLMYLPVIIQAILGIVILWEKLT